MPAWGRLEAALRGQSEHAEDVLADLGALCRRWDEPARKALIERFLRHAHRGVALPAAMILAVSDLLDRDA